MSPILELHLFTRTTPKLQDSCVKSTHLHHGKTLIFSSKVCFEPGSPGIPGGRNTLSPHFFSITKVRRGKRLHFLTCSNLETPCLPSDRFLSQEQDTFWGLGTQVFTHGAGLFFKSETQLFTEIGFATYVSRGPSRCLSSTFLLSNPNWPLPSLFWPSEFESKQSQRICFFWLEHFSSGPKTSVQHHFFPVLQCICADTWAETIRFLALQNTPSCWFSNVTCVRGKNQPFSAASYLLPCLMVTSGQVTIFLALQISHLWDAYKDVMVTLFYFT